jgi:hypothetical protein
MDKSKDAADDVHDIEKKVINPLPAHHSIKAATKDSADTADDKIEENPKEVDRKGYDDLRWCVPSISSS